MAVPREEGQSGKNLLHSPEDLCWELQKIQVQWCIPVTSVLRKVGTRGSLRIWSATLNQPEGTKFNERSYLKK